MRHVFSPRLFQCLLGAVLALSGAWGSAQTVWPTKPIKIIIPFPPGDSIDITARMIGPKLTEMWGQPVIVENIAGGSGQVGMAALARATPDGHTIGVGQAGNLVVIPHTFKKVPYDPLKNFVAVSLTTTNFQAIVANHDAPFKNLSEMIAYAKANPGKLSYGSSGAGTISQQEMELFKQAVGIDIPEIPYKSTAQAMTDLIGGTLSVFPVVVPLVAPHIQSGRVTALAVIDSRRSQLLPDIPAISEQVNVPGYAPTPVWYGFVAPNGTPAQAISVLSGLINAAMDTPDAKTRLVSTPLAARPRTKDARSNDCRCSAFRHAKIDWLPRRNCASSCSL